MGSEYRVTEIPIKLELSNSKNKTFADRWYLIKGRVKVNHGFFRVKIAFSNDKPFAEETLPVSCKGTILELIKIPQETKQITLKFISSSDDFKIIEDFSLKTISEFERIYRMYRRVLFFFKKRFEHERKVLGLSFYTLIFNLKKAYKLANKIRNCYSCSNYNEWIENFDVLNAEDIKAINQDIKKSKIKIKFIILVIDNGKRKELDNTLSSLESQLYKNFTTKILSQISQLNLNSFLKAAETEKVYIIILHAGTELSPHALYWIAKEAVKSDADFIYTDHDYINIENKRQNPYFKPDFSLEYLRSFNYIDFSFAVRAKLLREIELIKQEDLLSYDSHSLILKIIEKIDFSKIIHIPAILFHIPEQMIFERKGYINLINPVKEHLDRIKVSATVDIIKPYKYRVIYIPKTTPLISIIIPTKDQLQIFKKCISSIFKKTIYENFEIIVVDNKSTDKVTIEYLNDLTKIPKIKVLRYEKPFNFSAINNFAVNFADGEVLLFLNNDTEVITPNWLEIMLGCLEQPQVGAVGVKLYYPDGTIQHVGVVVGLSGCADHVFKGFRDTENGYMDRAILQQEYSAVTAACLMTWKELFVKNGGFDEINLPVSFNDVDYCLKLRESGYRIVLTPFVELYHHESVSRGKDDPKEADYLRKKWKKYLKNDPFYNSNLSYKLPGFSLDNFPRVKKPWE